MAAAGGLHVQAGRSFLRNSESGIAALLLRLEIKIAVFPDFVDMKPLFMLRLRFGRINSLRRAALVDKNATLKYSLPFLFRSSRGGN